MKRMPATEYFVIFCIFVIKCRFKYGMPLTIIGGYMAIFRWLSSIIPPVNNYVV
jgi:hypothetical protein